MPDNKMQKGQYADRMAEWLKRADDILAIMAEYFRLPDALLGSVIWEWLAPAICLTCCGGRANYAHLDLCPPCHGTGMAPRRAAPPAGLSENEWAIWEGAYQRALDMMHDLTRLACVKAAELLTENEEIT